MARKIVLVRHGPLADGYAGRYIGRMEPPLDAAWPSRPLAAFVQSLNPASCYCSPQLRARQTLDLIVPPGLEVRTEAGLREIDFGRWEGKTFREIQAGEPRAVSAWAEFRDDFAFPEGEALSEFIARTERMARLLAGDPAETVLAVTHGGVVQMLICHLLGLPAKKHLAFGVRRGRCAIVNVFDGDNSVLAGLNLPAQEGL